MNSSIVNLLGVSHNVQNYGVRVLLSSTVDSLMRSNPNLEIRVLDYGHDPLTWREKTQAGYKDLKLINLRYSWKLYLPNNIVIVLIIAALGRMIPFSKWRERFWNLNSWLRQVSEAKVNLSLSGGDSFSDIYGIRRLLYVLFPQILVILLEKPIILLPQTYGPFKHSVSRILARFVLKHAALVYSRDYNGIKIVEELLMRKDPKVQIAPDLGFAMDVEPLDAVSMSLLAELKRHGTLIGLNISSLLYMGGYTRKNMFGLCHDYSELIQILLSYLVREIDCQILLVPHVYGNIDGKESEESELTLCGRLLTEFEQKCPGRVKLIDRSFSHRQVKSVIRECDLFIGSRMHACIAAVSQGVPTVCLAYSDKFKGVMDILSSNIGVVDLRVASAEDTIEKVQKLYSSRQEVQYELLSKLPQIRAAIGTVFQPENFPDLN